MNINTILSTLDPFIEAGEAELAIAIDNLDATDGIKTCKRIYSELVAVRQAYRVLLDHKYPPGVGR